MTLDEAIKAAEELAEWYVEGMGDVHDIAYARQQHDLDMLNFFISVGNELNVQIDNLEKYTNNWLGDITAKELREILLIIAQKKEKA